MSRNYMRYFKTCLMALILSLSKFYPRLLMLSVGAMDCVKLCEESSHCSLWTYSSHSFEQSDSSTENKNSLPIQCSKVYIKPYSMMKKSFN